MSEGLGGASIEIDGCGPRMGVALGACNHGDLKASPPRR